MDDARDEGRQRPVGERKASRTLDGLNMRGMEPMEEEAIKERQGLGFDDLLADIERQKANLGQDILDANVNGQDEMSALLLESERIAISNKKAHVIKRFVAAVRADATLAGKSLDERERSMDYSISTAYTRGQRDGREEWEAKSQKDIDFLNSATAENEKAAGKRKRTDIIVCLVAGVLAILASMIAGSDMIIGIGDGLSIAGVWLLVRHLTEKGDKR